jgi:hypothetical protein
MGLMVMRSATDAAVWLLLLLLVVALWDPFPRSSMKPSDSVRAPVVSVPVLSRATTWCGLTQGGWVHGSEHQRPKLESGVKKWYGGTCAELLDAHPDSTSMFCCTTQKSGVAEHNPFLSLLCARHSPQLAAVQPVLGRITT